MSRRFCFLSARPKRSENDSRDMFDMFDIFEPTEPTDPTDRTDRTLQFDRALSAVPGRRLRSMVTLRLPPTVDGRGPLRRMFDRITGPTCGWSSRP